MIEFFYDSAEIDFVKLKSVEPVIVQIFSDHNFILTYENVILMTDEELLEINREFLKHDFYTDIITFNYAEDKNSIEGELYISVDRVKENAENQSVDFYDELYRIIVHGNLHLIGMKDDTENLKNEMHLVENKYISTLCSTWNI